MQWHLNQNHKKDNNMFATKAFIIAVVAAEVGMAAYTLNKLGALDGVKAYGRKKADQAKAFADEVKESYKDGRTGTERAEVVQ